MAVLVLHTSNQSRRPHFATARERCDRLAIMMSPVGWEADYADAVVDVGVDDLDGCVEAARRLDRSEGVEAVITFVEHGVIAAAAVAEALGLPSVSPPAALLARDKHAMRARLDSAGLPCPRFALADGLAQARAFAREAGYPLVLKPIIGGGSKYVRRVDSDRDLVAAFGAIQEGSWSSFRHDALWSLARRRYGSAVLVEQYVDGGEVSVESLVAGDRTLPLAIHDKPTPMAGPYFEERYSSTPSRLPAEVQAELHRLTAEANRALGIDVGATHTEFRVTPEGRPVFLEVAARIGGGPIYSCVKASTGVDMVAAVIDQARGRPLDVRPRPPRPAGLLDFFADREGRLVGVRGADRLRGEPGVIEVEVYRRPGDRVVAPPKTSQGDAHAVFVAATLDDLDALCARAQTLLTFDVAPDTEGARPPSLDK